MNALLGLAALALFVILLAFISRTPLSRLLKNARAHMSKPIHPLERAFDVVFFLFAGWVAAGGASLIEKYVHLPSRFHWIIVAIAWAGLFYVEVLVRMRITEIAAKRVQS